MRKTIIADTSCFIVLSKIGELSLLHHVYGLICTTPEIAGEFGETLPQWVEILEVKDRFRQQVLELQLDIGEASAIALALELPDSTLILDDYKARRIALQLGLNLTGTIGVLIKAKLNGHIGSIKPLLEKMRYHSFRLSEEIEQQALKAANELS